MAKVARRASGSVTSPTIIVSPSVRRGGGRTVHVCLENIKGGVRRGRGVEIALLPTGWLGWGGQDGTA